MLAKNGIVIPRHYFFYLPFKFKGRLHRITDYNQTITSCQIIINRVNRRFEDWLYGLLSLYGAIHPNIIFDVDSVFR